MYALKLRQPPAQRFAATPAGLADVLEDSVNLAVWQRELSPALRTFAQQLLIAEPQLALAFTCEADGEGLLVPLGKAIPGAQLPGYAEFCADLDWLMNAFVCLLGARRVGVRLRSLANPMCPRWHVDHVPLRLISTYSGPASQWLLEGAMDCCQLGATAHQPSDDQAQALQAGWVALAKGEKWLGNEGAGLIHRSPAVPKGQSRLLLTMDWLA
ncbi:DUF1826 domain-containing protein [Atopomonas sediminilitoris]|uniref:DUF1826 domain-containing protein n=1 Tax=Atopomonas sediminilitoris TaxID=2919919 RepID=UPI001F4D5B6A|nr:DUF1826 domain-containing protein [Atopomonas sediminilitoris]MCJ8169457.1 DUF1826 domain-containing protein [Atopomonas sediminilitoris]